MQKEMIQKQGYRKKVINEQSETLFDDNTYKV